MSALVGNPRRPVFSQRGSYRLLFLTLKLNYVSTHIPDTPDFMASNVEKNVILFLGFTPNIHVDSIVDTRYNRLCLTKNKKRNVYPSCKPQVYYIYIEVGLRGRGRVGGLNLPGCTATEDC